MKKLTPVIIVDEIESCLPFWVDRLGFEKMAEVPEGEALGFVILARSNVEIMYQTKASVAKDLGKPIGIDAGSRSGPLDPDRDAVSLYIEVDDLDQVMKAMEGIQVVLPERTTFYGSREFGVREPGGLSVVFAAFAHSA